MISPRILTAPRVAPALIALTAGLAACGSKDAPEFKLTPEQRAWADTYREGDTWRFRNANGYERRYKVTKFKDKMQPHVPKSLTVTHYQQQVEARLVREDSANAAGPAYANKYNMLFELKADVQRGTPYDGGAQALTWTVPLTLPIDAVNQQQALPAGFRLLPQATFAGRTFANVLEYTSTTAAEPWMAVRLYYTKAEGVIRFEEAGGGVWNRQ